MNAGTTPGLTDDDLPELFASADAASLRGQSRFIRSSAAQLVLLVLAAVAGTLSIHVAGGSTNWALVGGAAALFCAAVLKTHILATKPDQLWYEGRAAAESAKSLGWRYAVGGRPFPIGAPGSDEVDHLFRKRLKDVIEPLHGLAVVPATERGSQITPAMRALRAAPLEVRKAVYRDQRVENQQSWYARKANWNDRRANFWSGTMLVFELIGVVGALVKATTSFKHNLLAIAPAVVASAGAWLQTKQHQNLASAYAVAARELADVREVSHEPKTEAAWAKFVDEAEKAVSREHTSWQASRGR